MRAVSPVLPEGTFAEENEREQNDETVAESAVI